MRLTTTLWFATEAERAARRYVEIFGGAEPRVQHGPDGSVLLVEFTVLGCHFTAMNGARVAPSEAISFAVPCDTQEQIDTISDSLIADAGEQQACGWLRDEFGISWQILPAELPTLMADPEWGGHVMRELLTMRRIELRRLLAAGHVE
ncbi:VOC family protein [Tessaracoccus sp. G1721]